MPLPNRDIVSAIFESYITIRKPDWNLATNANTEEAIKTLPEKPAHKINVCLDVLRQIKQASSLEDWLKLLDVMFEKEKADEASYLARYTVTKMFIYYPMICNALHAARTYIISEIKSEPQFVKLKEESTREKVSLEKDILWDKAHKVLASEIERKQRLLDAVNTRLITRDDTDQYYNDFFTKTIMLYDPLAKTLDEKSFEHFKSNVQNKSRNLTQCERLLNEPANNVVPETTINKVAIETKTDAKPEVIEPKPEVKPVTIETKTEVKPVTIETKTEVKPETKQTNEANSTEVKKTSEPVAIKPSNKPHESDQLASPHADNNLFATTSARERRTTRRQYNYDTDDKQTTTLTSRRSNRRY